MRQFALHWQFVLSVLVGIFFIHFSWGNAFAQDWIIPFAISIHLSKLLAIPLIVAALFKDIPDLKVGTKCSEMDFRTYGIYNDGVQIAAQKWQVGRFKNERLEYGNRKCKYLIL